MKNNEDIRKLIEQFFSYEKTQQFTAQLEETDNLLNKNPAPQPDVEFVNKLKEKVSTKLKSKRTKLLHRRIYEIISAAAVLVIAGLVLMNLPLLQQRQIKQNGDGDTGKVELLSARVWRSSNLAQDDPQLSSYNEQLDQIRSELISNNTEEESSDTYQSQVSEIEAAFIKISNEFWKG